MPVTINHGLTATTPDNTSYEIRPSHWNSTHAATVSLVGSEVIGAFSNANGVSFGTNVQGAITASVSSSGGIGVVAGGTSQSTGVVVFQNSNNISFGLDGAGNLTGSVGQAGVIVSAGNVASNLSSIVFSNSNGLAFGLNGSTLTGSYTVPPAGITLAAGGVTENLSSLILSNSNGLAFGLNGSTLTGSYTVPSTAGLLSALALSAGIASTLLTGITLSNSNNVSFGENNGTVTASASFNQSNQVLTMFAASNTTQSSSGTVNASSHIFAGAGNVSVGVSNGSIVISGGATGTNPAIGAISAGTQSQSSGTVVFSNSNGVTFGLNNGTLTATVNPGPAAGIAAIAASNTTQTTGSLVFSASNGITFGLSSGAGAGTLTASYTVPTQTVQTQNLIDVTLAGNTSGTLALVSSGTLTLAGGNNITLSQVGNAVTISGASQVPIQTGISGLQVSNTTYTSGTVTFQNANGISFGSSGANGISASYTVPSTAGLISAINVSAGGVAQNLSNVVFSNSNGVSFGLNGSTVTGSIAAPVLGSVSAGTTSVGLGQVVFSNSNSVTFGLSGSTVTAQVYAPVSISAGTQAVLASGFTFSNSNGVSFGMNNGTITASVTTAAAVTAISGIQAGTQVQTSGTVIFSNSNNVSYGLNAGTLTEQVGLNLYAAGTNTFATTSSTYNVTALSLYGAGLVSIGHSNGSVIVSATNPAFSGGMSVIGNTLGTTGLATNRLVLAGGANITLSGSTNAGSMTISISGAAAGGGASTIGGFAVSNTTQSSSGTLTNSALSFVGAGIVSVGISNGSVVISGPASTGISQSLYATGNTTQSSSGTQAIGSILFQGAGNVSVGVSNGSVVISGAGGAGGGGVGVGVSTMGNTFGTTGTVTTGNVVLVGSGVISLSQSSSGSNATISIFGPATSSISGTGQVSVFLNASTISIGVPQLSLYGTSNTTQSSSGVAANGSLLFAGAGNVSVGVTNSSVVISVGAAIAADIGGNSTSAGAGYSTITSGTMFLAGGNNITLSQNGASITISGANAGGAQTGISGIVVSNTTYTSGTVSFSNANGISFGSSAGQAITASYTVPVQTNQTLSFAMTSNTTGNTSGMSVDARSLTIAGTGIISVGLSTSAGGSSLIISATQSNQAVSAQGGSSAFQTLVFTNSNNVSFSNTGGSIWGSYALNVSAPGGTSNALSAITFSNSNGVSFGLSTGAGVGTMTASVAAQTNQTLSWAATSNTAGNTSGMSVDARSLTIAGYGNASVGFSTSAGGSSIVVSVTTAAQTNQTLSLAANGNTTGNTSGMSVDARSLSLGGFGGASVGFSTSAGGSTVVFSSPVSSSLSATGAVSVSLNGNTWTVGAPAFSAGISGGNTAGNTGTVSNQIVLAGGNNITVSGSTNAGGMTVTISGGAGGAVTGISGIVVSNTTYTSGTVSFSNANGISFGSSAGQAITASYTVPTQTNQTVGLYGSSQTTNSSSGTVDARSISFVGQGNVSVGYSNGSFLINDGGIGASTGGLFATGNTTQNSSTTLALSSHLYNFLGAMTGGFSNGSVQISAPATSLLSATGLVSIVTQISTISIGVNAAGTAYSSGSTTGNMTGAINTNGITISVPYVTRFIHPPYPQLTALTAPGNASMSVQYVPIDMPVTGTRLDALVAMSGASTASAVTGAFAFSQYAIIYTLNGATLSSLSSGSTQTTYSYASNTAGATYLTQSAIRPVSVPINFNLAPGEYWVGFNMLTNTSSIGAATTALGLTLSMYGGNALQTAINYAEFGSNTATSSNLFNAGVYSAATTGIVTRLSVSAINQTGSALSAGNIALVFRNA